VILGSPRKFHLLPGLSVHNSSIDLPIKFSEIDGFPGIRIGKSDPSIREGVSIPPLRAWHCIISDDIVKLLAIETYEKQTDECT
jgi:hypothetical protein